MVLLLDPLPLVKHCAKFGNFVGQPGGPPEMVPPFLTLGKTVKARENHTRNTPNPNNAPFEPSTYASPPQPLNQGSDRENSESGADARIANRGNFLKRFMKIPNFPRRSDTRKTNKSGARMNHRSEINASASGRDNACAEDQYSEHCLFEAVGFRVPLIDYSRIMASETWQRKGFGMAGTIPTMYALEGLAVSDKYQDKASMKEHPLDYLLMIILWDTSKILRSMDVALAGIGSSMLDESRLQAEIDHWRKILNQFETKLRHMESSIRQFSTFISTFNKPELIKSEKAIGPKSTKELFEQCLSNIASVKQRTEGSYRSLITTMSLVESKRGIAEAESVTKLTELAFLFIPLTFSASVFSMQVKELNAATVSLGDFFIVAVVITISSYILRLFIRSPSVLRYWKRCKDEIRTSTNTPASAPIPTSSFIKWVWQRLDLPISPIYAMLLAAILMATLWTRALHKGIKVGMTIIFAISGLALILTLSLLKVRLNLAREMARQSLRR